ncbi:MAG: glucose 1-dehydrogenase [Oscillospiraceae bacterium]|nr:glucose 1-dehydrogenase [Oscillospiraceae bacterium]
MKLKGKVAIVTGASSGMGRDIAYHYAKEGANVIAVARRAEKLNQLVADAAGLEGKITAYSADLADKEKVEGMIDEAIKSFGKIDILVNNAGIMDDMSGIGEAGDEMFDKVFTVNVKAPFWAMKKAVGYFKKAGSGVIVNIASIGGLYGCRAGVVYTASKHAIVGMTKNTAYMYANQNIRCNAICPGGIETEVASGEFMKNINQEGAARATLGMNTNPRMGKGNEIAAVAVFLASDDASFVNGQCISVDGGWTAY